MPLRALVRAILVAGLAWLGSTACAAEDEPAGGAEPLDGGGGFLFGVATSGFQVDMGCPHLPAESCVDPHSDWYQFVTSPRMIRDPLTFLSGQDPAQVGPGHWELYPADFDLAARELNLNAFRMSIEWSRIFPTSTVGIHGFEQLRAVSNPAAVAHYHAVFDALRSRGLKPLVTLHHYTLPTWMHDAVGCHLDIEGCSPRGWLDRERIVEEAAKYAGFAAREFGNDVDLWATLNEPFAVILPGFILPNPERSNPPATLLRPEEAKAALVAMVEAHARMYDAVHANDRIDADGDGHASRVGIVYAMSPVAPKDPESPLDRKAAENVFYLWNMAFLNAVLFGDLDENLDGHAAPRADLVGRMDYVGINYYARIVVEGIEGPFFPQLSPLTTFNPLTLAYGVFPRGLYEMATLIHERSGLPIYITENNGQSDPENNAERETSHLIDHLEWMFFALDRGVDIRGYFYWSLMDNFEWNQGMKPFGLYAVDPEDPLKARRPRPTAEVYAEIAREGAIPARLSGRPPVTPPASR